MLFTPLSCLFKNKLFISPSPQRNEKKMTPSVDRLVPYTPHVHRAIKAAYRKWMQHHGKKEKYLQMHNQNRGRHCFPWSLSPGKHGTTGETVETLHCKRIRTLPREEAKKVKREKGTGVNARAFTQWRVLVFHQSCSPADKCSPLPAGRGTVQNQLSFY